MTVQDLINKAIFFNSIKKTENLFNELNNLGVDTLKEIEKQLQPDKVFRPVVLLRFLIIQLLLQKKEVNTNVIEQLKAAIENRDISEYYDAPPEFIDSLNTYKDSKKGMFPQWKNPFSITYTFFYPDHLKSEVTEIIKELGQQIIDKNNLDNVVIHPVGFDGSQNYGDDAIWGAIIPEQADNVQKAYQIFFRISSEGVNGGLFKGHKLLNNEFTTNDIKYDDWEDYLYATTKIIPHWKEENSKVNFKLHSDEKEFIKRLKQSSIAGNELFFGAIDRLINDLQIPEEDNLTFSVSQNRLSFHVGSRYCLSLFKDQFGFISSKKLEFPNSKEELFNGEPEAYWYKNNSGDTLLKYFDKVIEATQNELNRGHASKSETNKNVAFQKAAFDRSYRQRLFNQFLIPQFKGTIWKLGCVWGEGGIKSFYDYLIENNIVIGVEKFKYQIGDLIAITEGHNVKAIGQIKALPSPVTDNSTLQDALESFDIDYESWVNISSADIVQLNPDDEFEYKLRQGIRKIQQKEVKEKVIGLWYRYKSNPYSQLQEKNNSTMQNIPLNQILYGPPGTGKTYLSFKKAVSIIEGQPDDYYLDLPFSDIKAKYDYYLKEGQVVFTTFHQSYCYEDFIEGIKPQEPKEEGGNIWYKVEDGIFKKIAKRAKENKDLSTLKTSNKEGLNLPFDKAFSLLEAKIEEALLNEPDVTPGSMKEGLVVNMDSSFFCITGIIGKSIRMMNRSGKKQNTMTRDTLKEIYENPEDASKIITGGMLGYYESLVKTMKSWKDDMSEEISEVDNERFVIIIDEINRGNVASIFGELITLIEKPKRYGEPEQMEATLTYSKTNFTVPNNLYIIGTMNTADRSVEALDTALRRRFSFVEMQPELNLLEPKRMIVSLWNKEEFFTVPWDEPKFRSCADSLYDLLGIDNTFEKQFYEIGDKDSELWRIEHLEKVDNSLFTGINLKELLEVINLRIEKLLDKDHLIGHSYFLNANSIFELKVAFQNNIIPLLQEYFFGDYGKIGLVLGSDFFRGNNEDVDETFFAPFEEYESDSLIDRKIFHLYDVVNMDDEDFIKALNLLLRK